MKDNKSKIGIILLIVAVFAMIAAMWHAPNSFWQGVIDAAPNEHYENGQLIRTIRGQDFIVTGWGEGERLVPLAREDSQNTIVIIKTNYVRVE
jgi:hypothetical protein